MAGADAAGAAEDADPGEGMTESIALVVAIVIVVLLVALIPRRKLKHQRTRCPTCGVDRTKYPHKPRCKYWRDR